MSAYTEFFLNTFSNVIQYETMQISHSDFSKVYYIVRNATNGLIATIETLEEITFQYYPCKIKSAGLQNDIDQVFNIDFGDLGELLPMEIDRVLTAENFQEKPAFVYRSFRSDDLTAPLFGPINLEIKKINFNKNGCTFEAAAPYANLSKTGERYTLGRFPMLKGWT